VQERTWAVRIEIGFSRKFVGRTGRQLQEGRKHCIMRVFMLGTPHDSLSERSNQEREHLKYLGVDWDIILKWIFKNQDGRV
jgi:hypothetical protein